MRFQLDRTTRRRRTSLARIETLEPRSLLSGATIDVTTSADSGTGSLRGAITQADALNGSEPVSIVFNLPTTDPGYSPSTNSWTLQLASSLPTLTATGVTIDSTEGSISIPAGISLQGTSTPSDVLSLIGNGQQISLNTPDPSTTGSGSITLGGISVSYSGLAGVAVSNLASLTLETPNAANTLTVGSPALLQNQVSGTSGGVSIAPLSFSGVTNFTLNTASNDSPTALGDAIAIGSSGLVAAGLTNLTIETGPASSTLTVLSPSLTLPVPGGSFTDQASPGVSNSVVAQSDVNYSLTSNTLSIAGAGSLGLMNVQNVQLTGGPDSTSFAVNGWAGNVSLNGGTGSASLVFQEPGSYSGNLSLTDFVSTSIQIQGNFYGTITAPQTTTIQQISISGIDEPGSSITAGAFVPASGSTLPAVQIGGDFGGYLLASENLSIAGSGVLNSITIGGNLLGSSGSTTPGTSGLISTGTIGSITVTANLMGEIIAQGGGTIGKVTIGGNLGGTILAPEDPNPGSGTIGSVEIGGSDTGTISTGTLFEIGIHVDMIGTIIAQGAGVIGSVQVAGNLGGKVVAMYDPAAPTTSGTIGSISVGGTLSGLISSVVQIGQISVNAVSSTGSIDAGNVTSSLSVNSNMGSILAGSVASFVGAENLGTVNLGAAGAVYYTTIASGSVINATSIASLTVGQDIAGTVNVSGDLHQLLVTLGSMDVGSHVIAGTLESAYIYGNMAGSITVKGLLTSLNVGGSTPGSIVADQVGTISAVAGAGPVVLQVQEAGVERQLQIGTTTDPYPLPGDPISSTLGQVSFRYLYESTGFSSPQLTVLVSNFSGNTSPDQFDVSLVVFSGSSKFNLARIDASSFTGIGNVSVEGDILTSVSNPAANFFNGDSTKAGVQLPFDRLEGVEVRDSIPSGGYINATSIEAISVGSINLWGWSIPGALAPAYWIQNVLTPSTQIVQANGTFRVPFNSNLVGFFMDVNNSGQFNWSNVTLTVQNEVTVDSNGNTLIIPMNSTRGSDVALIQVAAPFEDDNSVIQGINIRGDGASITTFQWIDGPIVSSGPLGDLSLLNSQPVGSITASSIFGTILSYARFTGTIQTTGIWTDPVSGCQSTTTADFGRLYLNQRNQITTTTFQTYSGAMTGNLIIRGNLVSNVILNGGLSGQIDVAGNIGNITGSATTGGVVINGNDSGTIFTIGSILGNLTINGNLGESGVIDAGTGIIGSLTINGNMENGSQVISGAGIGSSTYGTKLTVYGNTNGIIASVGNLIEWSGDVGSPTTFANVGGSPQFAPSLAAIDEVFSGSTTSLVPLTGFDVNPFSLDQIDLNEMLTMIAQLHIADNGQLSVQED